MHIRVIGDSYCKVSLCQDCESHENANKPALVPEGRLIGSLESSDSARNLCKIIVQNKIISFRKTLLRNRALFRSVNGKFVFKKSSRYTIYTMRLK